MKRIRQSHIEEMIDHAKEHDPNECCGILAGTGEDITHLYRVKNLTPSPFRYVMDPKEQLEVMKNADDNGLELLCFYHSHTHSPDSQRCLVLFGTHNPLVVWSHYPSVSIH